MYKLLLKSIVYFTIIEQIDEQIVFIKSKKIWFIYII